MRSPVWVLAALLVWALPVIAANTSEQLGQASSAPALLPIPAKMQASPGQYQPSQRMRIALHGDSTQLTPLGALAAELLRTHWQREAQVTRADDAGKTAASDVSLRLAPDPQANPESYTLTVNADGIALQAPSDAGLFLGLQTLRQLLEESAPEQGLGFVQIEDAPRFGWRGLHLDVGRHLFPMDYIKQQLDLMARYKFNTLHWHLTDDQGWRLQIKRYPKLTEVGAWRKQTAFFQRDGSTRYDGKRYGGFYTPEQAREIVEYANKLHITVVPEIEMPGHAVAALASYPELACTPGPFEVRVDYGVDDNVFCPSEQTFEFLEGVLEEVLAIFPSEYIHVGGDEAPIVRWQQSKLAQDIIKREGLKDEHALQGWFMRRIEKYLQKHGRRMLAWDEMLAGKPAPTTTIMAWRGMEEGAKAARAGHDVVMTPVNYSYFDYCQSQTSEEPWCPLLLTLQQVYDFNPVPPGLTAEQARHIIGGQANLWTEHIRTPEHAQYMLWPRALAMAEALWSPTDVRDWTSFETRMGPQLAALGTLRINFRIPEVQGIDGDVLWLQPRGEVQLSSPLPGAEVVYTMDGSEPKAGSSRASGPVSISLDNGPVVLSGRTKLADGRLGPISRARYSQGELQPARPLDPASFQPKLQRDYYELSANKTDELLKAQPLRSDVSDEIGLPADARPEQFGVRWRGYLDIPADGVYRFALSSDDGSRLLIDDAVVIDRDGPQSPGGNVGNVALARGLHAFELRYFQGGGDKLLRLEVSRDGAAPAPVPATWWRHAP